MNVMYYTYMLRCKDNTIYTGITTDIKRRMLEHFERGEKCAKYTIRHIPEKLECAWISDNRKLASKLEYHIKTLTKVQKEKLINKEAKLEDFLSEKIECHKYSLYIPNENNKIDRKDKIERRMSCRELTQRDVK